MIRVFISLESGASGPLSTRASRASGDTAPQVQVGQLPWSAGPVAEGADTRQCSRHYTQSTG